MKRRDIRIKVMQILYAHEISGEPIEQLVASLSEDVAADEANSKFVEQLVYKVLAHKSELDKLITDRMEHWEFDRIAVIDKVLLRLGITELLYFEDIPPKVSINEAIEIAKKYSTEKSGNFINGILDNFLRELVEKNQLQKTGRGLIGLMKDRRNTEVKLPENEIPVTEATQDTLETDSPEEEMTQEIPPSMIPTEELPMDIPEIPSDDKLSKTE